MSYRDLRNFTEMMRYLGYPRLISMENFRTPNFELVAEIMLWLVQRYDPSATLPSDIDTEQDRVIFIKSVAQFMATKGHIKLNTKRLYMADGYSVKEMLKVTSVLHLAMKSTHAIEQQQGSGDGAVNSFDIASKLQDLKAVRQLASEVTQRGATLYHLLSQEPDLRESRTRALAQPLDINTIEKGLRSSIKSVENEIKKKLSKLDNVAGDEANLEAKIEKKKTELDRTRKRLATLQNVRPAFMDEFERLEEELKAQYEEYLIKFRNMTFLEHQMEELSKQERLKMAASEHSLKRIQNRLKEEEKKVISDGFLGDEKFKDMLVDETDSDEEFVRHDGSRPQNPARPHAGVRRGMYDVGGSEDDSLSSSEVDDDDISADELMMRDEAPEGEGPLPDDDEEDDDF